MFYKELEANDEVTVKAVAPENGRYLTVRSCIISSRFEYLPHNTKFYRLNY